MYTVYSKDNCPYCIEAIAILENRNLPFKIVKIGEDVSREHVINRFPTMKTVPVITLRVHGLEEGLETTDTQLIGGCAELRKHLGI